MKNETEDTDGWLSSLKYLPELKSKKPKVLETGHGSWFYCDNEGRLKRISILKQCIAETA
jgi:hypothetical protein